MTSPMTASPAPAHQPSPKAVRARRARALVSLVAIVSLAALAAATPSAAALAAATPSASALAPPALAAPAPAAAPAAAAAAARSVTYAWPLGSGEVTRAFDAPAQPWLAGHRGVDLAGFDGAVIAAAADGVVAFAGQVAGKPVVSIDHDDGLRTTYEPVFASVARGQVVRRGEAIGTLAPGHGTGTDLHWGARRAPRDYVDPTLLVAPPLEIRLLPLRR